MNLDEKFRQLRTNIEFSQFDKKLKVINVVSTYPNEGKSTVALNLAKTYGAQYKNVLLIDCDLRNPSLHKYLSVSNAMGLSNLMTHFTPQDDLLQAKEIQLYISDPGINFYVLTAGQRIPNPQELLSSHSFRKLIELAKTQFSMVIIDCPPCLTVADAIPVCNASDGTLYVISAKDTDKSAARDGVNELRRSGANIIGAVMTKADWERHRSSDSYYYYGYGYGGYEENEEQNEGPKDK